MPYPLTASVNRRLALPKSMDPKTKLEDRRYVQPFVEQRFRCLQEFADVISPTSTNHGAAFCTSTLLGDYRRGEYFKESWGMAVDLDKIAIPSKVKDVPDVVLWDECARRLPTLDQLLKTRLGIYMRLIYQSSSCPDGVDYVMGRVLLSFERPLNAEEHKRVAKMVNLMLSEDLPLIAEAEIKSHGWKGGIDSGALEDPVRLWYGIKHGRSPLFLDERVPPLPSDFLNSLLDQGSHFQINVIDASTPYADPIQLTPPEARAFSVLIGEILEPSGPNTYDSVYLYVRAFCQLCQPALDDAFVAWLLRSPYRLEKLNGRNLLRELNHDPSFRAAGFHTFFKALGEDTPDWYWKYYEHTGELLWFSCWQDCDSPERERNPEQPEFPALPKGLNTGMHLGELFCAAAALES